jgi:short-subunit dehydrogenase
VLVLKTRPAFPPGAPAQRYPTAGRVRFTLTGPASTPPEPFVAVVTGASSGIGESTARRLAREPGARLVLVARREDRLNRLAEELGGATVIAADLVDPEAPGRIADTIEREHGQLHLLVNNAGGSWRTTFGEGGWENVDRHMKLNFESPLRLTEALLPLLRRTAQSTSRRVSVVNVASTSARASRPKTGAYSASKAALAAWSDALYAEELPHAVHVGLVLPGFVATEGFPAAELREKAATRWVVSRPEVVAEAIVDAGPGGKAERYVPRGYWIPAALRILAAPLVRRVTAGGAFYTATGAERASAAQRD